MTLIANATTEPDGHEEIEITPEMIEAGKAILCSEPSVFAGPFGVDCDADDLITKVYRAMALAQLSLNGRAKRQSRAAL